MIVDVGDQDVVLHCRPRPSVQALLGAAWLPPHIPCPSVGVGVCMCLTEERSAVHVYMYDVPRWGPI